MLRIARDTILAELANDPEAIKELSIIVMIEDTKGNRLELLLDDLEALAIIDAMAKYNDVFPEEEIEDEFTSEDTPLVDSLFSEAEMTADVDSKEPIEAGPEAGPTEEPEINDWDTDEGLADRRGTDAEQ